MTGLLAVLSLGFFLGMRHATDPDHVIAVTTIVARQRSATGAAVVGAVWGVGHTLTMLIVGGGIIVFGWVIPPRVGLSTELSVGIMLIALGLMNMTGILGRISASASQHGEPGQPSQLHVHAHAHGDYVHTHVHGHDPESHRHRPDATPVNWLDRHFGDLGAYRLVRPLLVGVVHGLAGSAAIGLLVLATIRDPGLGIIYLLIFGLGTIVGMMLMTAVIALPFAYTTTQFVRLNGRLRVATGLLSLAFGLFVAYHIGIVDGLFTGQVHWTPE